MNTTPIATPTDCTTKRPGIRTAIRAGSEVYVCTTTVVNGKMGPISCEKLGELK